MRLSVGRKVFFGFGIIVLLLSIFGIVVLINLANIERQFAFVVEHDAVVIANARELSKLVVDMETGQRGFVITRKDQFLEPYNKGATEFEKLIEKEKKRVSDNPSQVKAFEKIERLIAEWKKKAAEPEIAMARKVSRATIDAGYLQELMGKGAGKEILDNLRAVLDELRDNFRKAGNKNGEILSVLIGKDMVDQETGQRGFIITGKEEFLEPFQTGIKSREKHAKELRKLVAGDPVNLQLVDKADKLALKWGTKAGIPEIEARREMNRHPETLKDVATLLQAGIGKNLLDQIREEFRRFIQVEEDLIAERYANAAEAARGTRFMTIMLIIFSIILSTIIATLITQGIAKPIGKLVDATALVAKGDLTTKVEIKSKDEIGDLATSFNQMANELEKAYAETREKTEALTRSNKELQQFTYVAAHDLQEPLRMVASYMQLLEKRYKGQLDSDADEFIGYAVEGAIRMQRMLEGLLAYSGVGTRGKEFNPIDCQAVLNEAVTNLHKAIKESGTAVTHDPLPTVMGNGTQLTQLFQNLIGNAIKFRNDQPPEVQVGAENKDGEWLFSVRDSGIGIDSADKDRIFLIFQRLHGRGEYPGTGIGLAICKKIVQGHGGHIWVESQPGKGSTFYFTIPQGHSSQSHRDLLAEYCDTASGGMK